MNDLHPMEITDAILLQQIAMRKAGAFNQLYSRYNRLFYRWVYTRTADKEMTEDIVQNFWLQVWTDPAYFKSNEQGSAKNFFLQTLTFRMLNYLKSAAVRTIGDESLIPEAEKTLAYSHILEDLQEHEIYKMIDEVLNSLPQLTKDVFSLRWDGQYSVKEIAGTLNISEKMVRSRYQSALSLLRERLSGMYPEGHPDYLLYVLTWFLLK